MDATRGGAWCRHLRNLTRGWLRRPLAAGLNATASLIEDALARHQQHREAEAATRLRTRQLQGCGRGVGMGSGVRVSEPRACVVGNNCQIGADVELVTEGGLTIGDHTHIEAGARVVTWWHDIEGTALPHDAHRVHRPVRLGSQVLIGRNAQIEPGVRIGDGAVVRARAVVAGDVAPGEVVAGNPARITRHRDPAHHASLVAEGRYSGDGGYVRGVPEPLPHGAGIGANLVFVLTTGRSGSMSIARALDTHPAIRARHEPRYQLIRLSTEYAHGLRDRAEVRAELAAIFHEAATFETGLVHVESDQKYFNLVPLLHELLPAARFVWLLRDPREVVASAEARGWFRDGEYHPENPPDEFKVWCQYRLNGARCGAYTEAGWDAMSAFERCCWYWQYVNATIETGLAEVDPEQVHRTSLTHLNRDMAPLLTFLGVPVRDLRLARENTKRAGDVIQSGDAWSDRRRRMFEAHCADGCQRWLPELDASWP